MFYKIPAILKKSKYVTYREIVTKTILKIKYILLSLYLQIYIYANGESFEW